MSLVEKLLKRFNNAESARSNFDTTYREAFEFFSPNRDSYKNTTSDIQGTKRNNTDKIYDSTGQDALRKAVSNLHSSLFPPQKQWAALKLGPALAKAENASELARQLEEINAVFFNYLFVSNFDTQIAEVLEDLLIGTGCLLMQKGTIANPFIFTAVPLSQVFLERGPDGGINAYFRKWEIEQSLIKQTWEDANINSEFQQVIDAEPHKKITIIEITTRAKIKVKSIVDNGDGTGRMVENEIDGYKYYVIKTGGVGNGQLKEILVERQMRTSPWIVIRYGVSAGETYGRGPVLDALPDCKTLNKTNELILKNASLAVSGAYTAVDDGVLNIENIQIAPGAIIPVTANPGNPNGPTLSVLPVGANFNVAQIVLENLKKSIRSILMVDPLGEIDAPVKSATEISYRAQQVAKLLGSAYGRIQIEGVKPILNNGLRILEELGLLDLKDFSVDGVNLAVSHNSPLAKAQSEEEITAMQRFAETISTFYGPQMMAVMTSPVQFATKLATLMEVPASVLPTQEQLQQIMATMQQAQAAQQQPETQVL